MYLNTIKIAKEVFKDKELILEKIDDKRVKIFYRGKTSKPKPIILPYKIELDEKLGEFCGLYYAEGFNSKNSCPHITQFTNSEPELIRQFMGFMIHQFYFRKEEFTYKIKTTKGKIGNFSKKKSIEYWKKELRLNNRARIKYSYDSKIINKYSHRMMVYFGNTIFRKILSGLIDLICKESITNHNVKCGFLRGLFAGEGCVILNKKSLFSIEISQGYKNQIRDKKIGKPKRSFIKRLLRLEDIQVNNNKQGIKVIVTNLNNLEKFYILKLHKLHPKKANKFEEGFIKLKKNKRAGIPNKGAELEILSLLSDRGPLSMVEIYSSRKKSKMATVDIIKGRIERNQQGLLKRGHIFICDRVRFKHSKKPSEIFNITPQGKNYKNFLEREINNKYYV